MMREMLSLGISFQNKLNILCQHMDSLVLKCCLSFAFNFKFVVELRSPSLHVKYDVFKVFRQ